MICADAGLKEGGKDACQGDSSGSPHVAGDQSQHPLYPLPSTINAVGDESELCSRQSNRIKGS